MWISGRRHLHGNMEEVDLFNLAHVVRILFYLAGTRIAVVYILHLLVSGVNGPASSNR